jgi:hypothetical protein
LLLLRSIMCQPRLRPSARCTLLHSSSSTRNTNSTHSINNNTNNTLNICNTRNIHNTRNTRNIAPNNSITPNSPHTRSSQDHLDQIPSSSRWQSGLPKIPS